MPNPPTILITGINGYLGRHIAKDCETYGAPIIGTGRQSKSQEWPFRQADLLKFDAGELLNNVDVVIHSAAIIPNNRKKNNFEENVIMTRNLIEACVEKNINHLIYISSASVYKTSNAPNEESHHLQPASDYGKSKLLCEEELNKHEGSIRISILRMGTIFGPNMPDNNNIRRLINAIASNRFVQLGSGQNQKSLLHIYDAARACSHLAFNYKPEKNNKTYVFNIAPPALTMKQIVEAICKGLGKNKPITVPSPLLNLTINLLSSFAKIFRVASLLHTSISKFTSNDVVQGTKFISQTDFKFKSDTLYELTKVSQNNSKI